MGDFIRFVLLAELVNLVVKADFIGVDTKLYMVFSDYVDKVIDSTEIEFDWCSTDCYYTDMLAFNAHLQVKASDLKDYLRFYLKWCW